MPNVWFIYLKYITNVYQTYTKDIPNMWKLVKQMHTVPNRAKCEFVCEFVIFPILELSTDKMPANDSNNEIIKVQYPFPFCIFNFTSFLTNLKYDIHQKWGEI